MQEWLKDKKNLPIVVALAVFFVLAAGGLVALELGAFSQQAAAPVPATPTLSSGPPGPLASGGPSPGSLPAGVPPLGARPGGPPVGAPPGRPPFARPGLPTGVTPGGPPTASAAPKKSDVVNPLIGPDPFGIPGGAKKLAASQLKLTGPKLPLRDQIGPLNLFQIRPPTPPAPPPLPPDGNNPTGGPGAAPNYHFIGVITGGEGVNAILEAGGQSQSVKPGDSLPDGTQVQNIQATSITLRSPSGSVFNLPLSADNPDQGNGPYNGQPQYPYGGGFGGPQRYDPRQQFNPRG